MKPIFPMLLALGCLAGTPATAQSAFERIKVDAGETLFFSQCRRCHVVDATDPSYGPPLDGIVGRMAGSYDGYEYSEALANAGFAWTDAALRAWMEDNAGFIPGTKMRHVGILDRTVQDFILAYLKTIE